MMRRETNQASFEYQTALNKQKIITLFIIARIDLNCQIKCNTKNLFLEVV